MDIIIVAMLALYRNRPGFTLKSFPRARASPALIFLSPLNTSLTWRRCPKTGAKSARAPLLGERLRAR